MDRSVSRQLLSSILLLLSSLTVCHARGPALHTAPHKLLSGCLRLRGGRVRYEQVIAEHDLQLMRAAAAAALRMDQTNPEGWLSLGDVRCVLHRCATESPVALLARF